MVNAKLVFVAAAALGAAFVAAKPPASDCDVRCEELKGAKSACQRGCSFYGIRKADPGPLSNLMGQESVLIECRQDCSEAYRNGEALNACRKGCDHRSNDPKGHEVKDGNGGFGISFGLPKVFDLSDLFGLNGPRGFRPGSSHESGKLENSSSSSSEESGLASFFNSVHRSMRQMMRSMMSRPFFSSSDENGDTSMPLRHAGGELVVIKSGPGYHEEKRYHLGPDTDINKILGAGMDDMMEHANPIDKFKERNDVEVFDPVKLMKESRLPADKDNNAVVRANGGSLFDTDPWGFIKAKAPAMEGPRLPETGLKSHEAVVQPRTGDDSDTTRYMIVARGICSRHNGTATWSDWMSCLHARMGLPTWLLGASVALGVLFTLWLCLVIPSSAPKQKVKKGKLMIGTKEAEATMGISTVIMGDPVSHKVDLPPPYDEVKEGLVPPEPVHGFKANVELLSDKDEAAGPLPEKRGESQA